MLVAFATCRRFTLCLSADQLQVVGAEYVRYRKYDLLLSHISVEGPLTGVCSEEGAQALNDGIIEIGMQKIWQGIQVDKADQHIQIFKEMQQLAADLTDKRQSQLTTNMVADLLVLVSLLDAAEGSISVSAQKAALETMQAREKTSKEVGLLRMLVLMPQWKLAEQTLASQIEEKESLSNKEGALAACSKLCNGMQDLAVPFTKAEALQDTLDAVLVTIKGLATGSALSKQFSTFTAQLYKVVAELASKCSARLAAALKFAIDNVENSASLDHDKFKTQTDQVQDIASRIMACDVARPWGKAMGTPLNDDSPLEKHILLLEQCAKQADVCQQAASAIQTVVANYAEVNSNAEKFQQVLQAYALLDKAVKKFEALQMLGADHLATTVATFKDQYSICELGAVEFNKACVPLKDFCSTQRARCMEGENLALFMLCYTDSRSWPQL